jgi:hypothetical protein
MDLFGPTQPLKRSHDPLGLSVSEDYCHLEAKPVQSLDINDTTAQV